MMDLTGGSHSLERRDVMTNEIETIARALRHFLRRQNVYPNSSLPSPGAMKSYPLSCLSKLIVPVIAFSQIISAP